MAAQNSACAGRMIHSAERRCRMPEVVVTDTIDANVDTAWKLIGDFSDLS